MTRLIQSLEPAQLEHFLESRSRASPFPRESSLARELAEVLQKANEFVPSQAGSILLDNPATKTSSADNTLTFIAAFGDKAASLLGRTMGTEVGIAGHVYTTGRSHYTGNARRDLHFFDGIDQITEFRTESLVAIPIRLGNEVCGVLELIRDHPYEARDRRLLEIFAEYISVSIQNVLDARHAQAIAKRDNLTGLFNDRYLHVALADAIHDCREREVDLCVLFIDLDYFKRINDSHGHLAGSQVLKEVGDILGQCTTAVGGLAARYGGDEFVIVLPGLDLRRSVKLAEDIRTTVVSTTFCATRGEIQPEPLHLKGQTASIGAASMMRHADLAGTDRVKTALLHLADAAMYAAKETGRNRTAIAPEPVHRADDERRLVGIRTPS